MKPKTIDVLPYKIISGTLAIVTKNLITYHHGVSDEHVAIRLSIPGAKPGYVHRISWINITAAQFNNNMDRQHVVMFENGKVRGLGPRNYDHANRTSNSGFTKLIIPNAIMARAMPTLITRTSRFFKHRMFRKPDI